MPEIDLVGETGRRPGTRDSKRLRREGKVPAVVYGHGTEPIAVAVDGRELRHALNTDAGVNALVNLSVDGVSHLTMPRVLQRHPVRHNVIHVDFQVVNRDEVVSAEVPINLVGEATLVHNADGVLGQQLFSLTILATPGRIPPHIEVDVSEMTVGDSIRIADLALPTGVTTELDPEEAVVIAQASQVSDTDLVGVSGEGEGTAADDGGEAGEGSAESST